MCYSKQQLRSLDQHKQLIDNNVLKCLREMKLCKPEYKKTKRGKRGGRKTKHLSENIPDKNRSNNDTDNVYPMCQLNEHQNDCDTKNFENDIISQNHSSDDNGQSTIHEIIKEVKTKDFDNNKCHNKHGGLVCFYTNSDSLLNKRAELAVEIQLNNPDIIAICEVKPKNCRFIVQPEELQLPGFDLFHNLDCVGRGIVLLVKTELKPTTCDFLEGDFQEEIFVDCKLRGHEILTFGLVYRCPSSSSKNSNELNQLIRNVTQNKDRNLLIVGDFNYPEISWSQENSRTKPEHDAAIFLETCKDTFLIQHQTELTRYREGQKPSLIDLVLTNKEEIIEEIITNAGLGKSDHCTLIIKLSCFQMKKKHVSKPLFYKADYDAINSELKSINWEQELETLDTEASWKFLKEIIDGITAKYVPMSKPGKRNGNKWMSKKLLKIVREKHRTFRKAKWCQSKENITLAKRAKNKSQRECKRAKREFEKNIASDSKTNPKTFWSHATNKLKFKTGVADLIKADGSKTTSDSEKADILNTFFQSVFTVEPTGALPVLPEYSFKNVLTEIEIPVETVFKLLSALQTGKAAGPDGMNPLFLSRTSQTLALPITILFRKSLAEGKIPNEWRLAHVCPIFKKGDRSSPNNYRPVSLTCILCKIMEKIIRASLVQHLEANDIISKFQHGFVSGRSCITQILDVLDMWTNALDDGGSIDAIYMDFQKAFDSVPHRRLVAKVRAHGIDANILQWIEDFLRGRAQKVIVNDECSSEKPVTSGIPQGSVIGPLLFVIYINDLPTGIQSELRMFADDTKIFTRSDKPGATMALQNDLNQLQNWSEEWLLKFHPNKCHVLKLGYRKSEIEYKMMRKNTDGTQSEIVLEESEQEKDLGIYVDNKLTFKHHVQCTTAKANRITGIIRRSFDFLSEEMFIQLYKGLVRPILEYGNSAWQPQHKTLCQEIENVQRRATKLLASIRNLPYTKRLAKLKLPSLEHRRKRGDMIELYKYIHGFYHCDSPKFQINENKRTRGHSLKLVKKHHKLQVRGNFISVRAVNIWNSLPEEVVNAPSVNVFKSRLDNHWFSLPTIFDPECYH